MKGYGILPLVFTLLLFFTGNPLNASLTLGQQHKLAVVGFLIGSIGTGMTLIISGVNNQDEIKIWLGGGCLALDTMIPILILVRPYARNNPE